MRQVRLLTSLAHRLNPLRLSKGIRHFVRNAWRRKGWFIENTTPAKLINMIMASVEFGLKRERMTSWPVALNIDISPLCNLRCTACIHADPNGNPLLEKQEFHGGQRMPVEQYRRIIDEIKGRSTAVTLYYLGDPMVHPHVDEMCTIARAAGLNVHTSTNFSFSLSDARIRRLVTSGLTHLTVCVDGLTQQTYGLTRVGGRIDRVLSNLRRVCECRKSLRQHYPQIEVQYIKYKHNLDELDEARRIFTEFGIDHVTDIWGGLHNWTDHDPGNFVVFGPKTNALLPQCFWPYFSMVIKYNGDVIPCCCYRHGQQYTSSDDPRVLGNVFETSVREVWTSPAYQHVRRLVANPESIKSDASLEESFCHACKQIFETDVLTKRDFRGTTHSFEELYAINEEGRPVRRRVT